METLLHIDTSIYSTEGESSRLAAAFVAEWSARHPDGAVITRDLAVDPIPHIDAYRFRAFTLPAGQRSPEQQAVVDDSDRLIGELKRADVIALGLPMYNFGVPSTLKAYFDHVARAGVTFRYTEKGSEGLLKGKRAYIFATRGGKYGSEDLEAPYVRNFLGFLGIEDVRFVIAEGLALGEDSKRASLAQAHEAVRALPEFMRQAA